MKQFWQEVLLLPYKSNSQDNPHHESQVEELIIKYNYKYEYQPNGSHQSPDFRVTLPNGRIVNIECKSSKGAHPVYNGGLPKEGTVYIFSSAKYNQTTIFFSEDVVSAAVRKWLEETVVCLNKVLVDQQQTKPADEFNRGFDFYIRNMYTQAGKGKKDYFKHSDRQLCEQNVLDFNW
jgi:hypothetical protein